MFYYIDQPHFPSFPIGLVKTESDFIVRSIEMNAGGSCDKCQCLSFFGFLRPNLPPWGYKNRCFLVALCRLIVRRQNLEGKNTEVVLVQYCAWKFVPTAISGGVEIFEVPGCHLLRQMSSKWGSQILLQGLVSHELVA